MTNTTELASALNVDRSTVTKRLKAMGMIQKANYWTPHEVKDRDIERRKTIWEIFLQRQQRKDFLHELLLEMNTTKILNACNMFFCTAYDIVYWVHQLLTIAHVTRFFIFIVTGNFHFTINSIEE